MESNDKALMVAVIGALLLTWQYVDKQAIKADNTRLQAELSQMKQQFDAYRLGVNDVK